MLYCETTLREDTLMYMKKRSDKRFNSKNNQFKRDSYTDGGKCYSNNENKLL